MARSCISVELDDKEVRDALVEAAKRHAGLSGANTSTVSVSGKYNNGNARGPVEELAVRVEFTNIPRKMEKPTPEHHKVPKP